MSDGLREAAVTVIQEARQTHVDWIVYLTTYPDEADAQGKAVGSPEHHTAWVEKYDTVLAALAAPPVLTLDTDLVAALRELADTGPLHEGVVSVPAVPLGAPRAGERVR